MQEAELRLNQLTASFQKKIDEQATANYLAEEQRASTQKALDQMVLLVVHALVADFAVHRLHVQKKQPKRRGLQMSG